MQNYKIALGAGIISVLLPVGIAFAHTDIQVDTHADAGLGSGENQPGLNVELQSHSDAEVQGEDAMDNHGDDGSEMNGDHKSASSTDLNEHANAKAMMRGDNADEHGDASSSKEDNGNHYGFGRGGIRGFFDWLFGLPASTTVGDIRTQMAATTTSESTGSSQGLGRFFHDLFGSFKGFFGGGGDDN